MILNFPMRGNMNIQGIEILTEKIIYSPQWFGIAAWVIMMSCACLFALLWLDGCEAWAGPLCWISFALFIICIALTFSGNNKTIFNYPSKIEYTIEITNDNAWKELGPNYIVKEKPYETKEIYVVEGEYVNDNS